MTEDQSQNEPADPIKREAAARAIGTKQKIIAAALHEFAEHGKEGARVDRISESAGVNKAMIYYHFDSKDRLYREVLVGFYRQIGERARASVMEVDNLEEALLALATLHAESVMESEEIIPLIMREMIKPEPEILFAIAEVFASSGLPKRIMVLLQENMSNATIRQLDVRHVMVAFISMSLGYMAIAPLVNRVFDIPDRNEFIRARPPVMVDIFLNGLKASRL